MIAFGFVGGILLFVAALAIFACREGDQRPICHPECWDATHQH